VIAAAVSSSLPSITTVREHDPQVHRSRLVHIADAPTIPPPVSAQQEDELTSDQADDVRDVGMV
jgi:hypothetical protein